MPATTNASASHGSTSRARRSSPSERRARSSPARIALQVRQTSPIKWSVGRPVAAASSSSSPASAARSAAKCGPSRQWCASDTASAATTGSSCGSRVGQLGHDDGIVSRLERMLGGKSNPQACGERRGFIEVDQGGTLRRQHPSTLERRAMLVYPQPAQTERGFGGPDHIVSAVGAPSAPTRTAPEPHANGHELASPPLA